MLRYLLASAILILPATAGDLWRHAPAYTAEAIVNAATNQAGPIAPNTLVSIYGTGLCMAARAVSAEDLRGGVLPTVLPGTGCRVMFDGIPANIYYASPTQINFLVPSNLIATRYEIRVTMNALNGPAVRLQLAEAAPGLFQLDPEFVVATRPDGSVITPDNPAAPGDVIVLYATGLGRTSPRAETGQIATTAARVTSRDFRLLLEGIDVEPTRAFYVGLTPGFAGLYQINLTLPENLFSNPPIRIGFGDLLSPEGLKLPLTSSVEAQPR
jgi:uncharacterized protein (TIGR03437 family)